MDKGQQDASRLNYARVCGGLRTRIGPRAIAYHMLGRFVMQRTRKNTDLLKVHLTAAKRMKVWSKCWMMTPVQ